MSANLLDKSYEPHDVERRWYDYWEQEQLFAAKETSAQKSYSIVIPPPNVTGVLHMGHALNNTMQDILCRYRRQRGDNVLWMPGTDHAGIATQNVVERMLAAKGQDRHQLGREKFIEAVWQWRSESGSAIINQLKRLGASCDWARERFTMDEGLSKAVRKVFVELYRQGLIFRGNYIINWCHRCHTALSDLEVEHEDHDGHLWHIRYPLTDGGGEIIVATTRPETMLGDTAVAVHPEDERFQHLIGKTVRLPLMNREIPIIADKYVDKSFGTGGLKITPAHDPNDFEIGQRHQLDAVKVISDDGIMSAEAGRFEGMDPLDCRKAVVTALESEGLLVKVQDYAHSVGHCYRCKAVVEPNLSRQWFVRAKPLADKAAAAVRQGKTKIVPAMWEKTYFDWLDNIKDWCISRQIWWGHQIPAWNCSECGELIVAEETPTACSQCGSSRLAQDTDVLDTWFSSALWPFSTMGWPEKTPLLATFYPTSVLITGFDILFFWVARMMMMGIHFMGDIPFGDVYVHALVRDKNGEKMSKSKGNVIDPLTVMDEYGTDAFRFTLAAFAAQGRDVRMDEKRVEGYRHFVNKIWNAARLALMHIETVPAGQSVAASTLADRWILSRLKAATDEVARALDGYHYNEGAAALYKFVWHEFCDWYLEAIKPVLYGDAGDAQQNETRSVLASVLADTLVLLHPFMPFVTEEIWHKLPATEGSIMQARFPGDRESGDRAHADPEAEAEMALVIEVITAIRNIRGEMNVTPAVKLQVVVQTDDPQTEQILTRQQALIVNLARLSEMNVAPSGDQPKGAAAAIVGQATVMVLLEGIVDFAQETQRLEKAIGKLDNELATLNKKLHNEGFLNNAPPEVVANVRAKYDALTEKHDKLAHNLERVRAMGL